MNKPVNPTVEGAQEMHGLDLLRMPFPENQISKLPKPTKRDAPRGKCKPKSQGGDAPDWQEHFCGGYHGLPAVHLDYVGHAALTDRLLSADPHWNWEPMGLNEDGTPAFDRNGGLWIRLTVCGITRPGYGSAEGKSGGDAVKEIIGDALRNAAMRFGAALDLWHKGDLHIPGEEGSEGAVQGQSQGGAVSPDGPTYTFPEGVAKNITELKAMARNLWREIEGTGDDDELSPLLATEENKAIMAQLAKLENPAHREIWEGDGKDNPGIAGLINKKREEFAVAAFVDGKEHP